MIFETWFLLAVVSALSGGVASFLYKVAAKEKIDIVVLSFYTAICATIVLFILTWMYSGFYGFWEPMVIFAGLTAITYLVTNITKVKALENVDAALFFPLYKVFGPTLVIVVGLILFDEMFSWYEWVGLVLSLLIPLLLITRAEDARQMNLRLGLLWLGVTVIIGAASAAFWKLGTDLASNTFMYILVGEVFVVLASALTLWRTHGYQSIQKLRVVNDAVFIKMLIVSAIVNTAGALSMVFAFATGGALGIVYTINSLYILIPIVLSIIFYNEHWNLRKATAIVLSVVALAFFA